ncbi:hypothetical protein AR543_07130 [Paenibacillus bovis]|uniref:Uncharacterized protein n=1 Tax=Paenibacillus bovis TaxID=1616788 RepID=A0A172ZF65_9BACL|nr:hypothetical protein AR543_07130 [Paenibacillus bovis]
MDIKIQAKSGYSTSLLLIIIHILQYTPLIDCPIIDAEEVIRKGKQYRTYQNRKRLPERLGSTPNKFQRKKGEWIEV